MLVFVCGGVRGILSHSGAGLALTAYLEHCSLTHVWATSAVVGICWYCVNLL